LEADIFKMNKGKAIMYAEEPRLRRNRPMRRKVWMVKGKQTPGASTSRIATRSQNKPGPSKKQGARIRQVWRPVKQVEKKPEEKEEVLEKSVITMEQYVGCGDIIYYTRVGHTNEVKLHWYAQRNWELPSNVFRTLRNMQLAAEASTSAYIQTLEDTSDETSGYESSEELSDESSEESSEED
jgi:hypothetical protein